MNGTPMTPSKYQARPELFPAFSVVDDAQKKVVAAVGANKPASSGKMELYTPTYYAACTFGGLLACV